MELNEHGRYVVDHEENKQWQELFATSEKRMMEVQNQRNLQKFYQDYAAYF